MSISLRDHFASDAMKAILANPELKFLFKPTECCPEWNEYILGKYGEKRVSATDVVAKLAFEMADAMLKQSNYFK